MKPFISLHAGKDALQNQNFLMSRAISFELALWRFYEHIHFYIRVPSLRHVYLREDKSNLMAANAP
jgi:hypothetical protein